MSKYLKCTCSSCGGHIEFPAEGIGSTVTCPHCGWPTELTLETPTIVAARPSRSLKWAITGGVILFVGLAAAVGILIVAQRYAKKNPLPSTAARSAVPPSHTNVAKATANPNSPVQFTNDFSCSPVAIEQAPGTTFTYATGTLKNDSDKQRFGVTVQLDLFDKAGSKIGTTKDYMDVIEPRTQWKFRAPVLQKNAASARVMDVKEQ